MFGNRKKQKSGQIEMLNKPLDQITSADIEALIANEVAESKTIEYKEQLPGNSESEKKEFLADVSSFANVGGGNIVYGIKEKEDDDGKSTGLPEEIVGLVGINIDQEKLRLESSIRDGIGPRIPNIQPLKMVEGIAQGAVIILRIQKSWAAPHMVTFKNTSRFYSRTSNGKYQMDINEIRTAFLQSEILEEKMKKFRDERIKCIKELKSPILYPNSSLVLLHLIPFSFLDPEMRIDISSIDVAENFRSLGTYCNDWRYNADGFLKTNTENPVYLQFFHSGVMEAASPKLIHNENISGVGFEGALINSTESYLGFYERKDVSPPVFLFLSLLNINGIHFNGNQGTPIDRDDVLFPEILIEDFSQNPREFLRPLFNMVWQAGGYGKSHNYDDNGHWIGDRR